MRGPQNSFEPFPNPKNRPLGPQKVITTPKTKSNSIVIIEGSIENESCSTIWVDLKTVYELKPTPKIARNGLKRLKMTQKLKEI